MKRNATAVWNGTGKEGTGHVTTQSTVLNKTQYSYNSRFAEGIGTNPEELLAAALSGCYTMKLTFMLGAENFTATELETRCDITLDAGVITLAELAVKGSVPGITAEKFAEVAEAAKNACLVANLFVCPKVVTSATLA